MEQVRTNNKDNVFNSSKQLHGWEGGGGGGKQEEVREVNSADWQTGAFLQNYHLKTYFFKLPVQSLIWAEREGPYSCANLDFSLTSTNSAPWSRYRGAQGGGDGKCREEGTESCRCLSTHEETRETVPSFLHSGRGGEGSAD